MQMKVINAVMNTLLEPEKKIKAFAGAHIFPHIHMHVKLSYLLRFSKTSLNPKTGAQERKH